MRDYEDRQRDRLYEEMDHLRAALAKSEAELAAAKGNIAVADLNNKTSLVSEIRRSQEERDRAIARAEAAEATVQERMEWAKKMRQSYEDEVARLKVQSNAQEKPMDEELERRMVFARERVAQAWCDKETSGVEMDSRLAEAFARRLVVEMYKPNLGCATTGEILDELRARCDVNYSTIGGRAPAIPSALSEAKDRCVDLLQRMQRRYSPEALSVMMGKGFVVEVGEALARIVATPQTTAEGKEIK